jgi:hypothetical protein
MGTFLGNRWDTDFVNKRIFRDTAESPTVTDSSLALYSALQDLFDEPDQMDDPVPMSAQTPTEFSLINGWFLDDESTEYLTGGAIQSVGWGTGDFAIRAISYDATTPFAGSDLGLTLTGGSTGDEGIILAFDDRYVVGDQGVVWLRQVGADDLFDDAATEAYTVGGSSAAGAFTDVYAAASGGGLASETGDSLWSNPFSLGTIAANTTLYVYQDDVELISRAVGATNRWWAVGQIDLLVKVKSTDVEIDDGEITVFARQYTQGYDNFIIDLTTGGRQPVPFATGNDLNNTIGYRQQVIAVGPTDQFTIGEVIEDDSDETIQGVITASSGVAPDITIEYYLIGPALADFSGATGQFTGATSGIFGTAVAPTDVGPKNLGVDPTVVFAATDVSLGGGQPAAPYSIAIDVNGELILDLFEFLKYETGRGITGAGGFVFDAEGINGEAYTGNALQAEYSSPTGTFVEGETLYFHDTGDVLQAQGVLVADHLTADDLILRNVRVFGTNTITQVGDNVVQASYTDFATVDTTRTITTPKAAPFGTFAGGTFFGAPGVILTDLHANDVQAFQLVDDDGNVQAPPNFVNATVSALNGTDSDRVAVFVLTAPLGVINKVQHDITAPSGGFNGVDDILIRTDVNPSVNITPESGTVRVVDNINNVELRFRYDSFAAADFSLTVPTDNGSTATSIDTVPATTLTDTAANFTGAATPAAIGDIINNRTDNSWGVVTALTPTVATHTPLTGGSVDDWEVGDVYGFNEIPYDLDAGDTAYVPIIDTIAAGGDPVSVSSANVVYTTDIDVLVRVRNGGSVDPIVPFEVENTVTDTGMQQAAIRTSDTIAT